MRKTRAPEEQNPQQSLRRVVIENVKPQIDGGRFPIKRVVGERVDVTADIFADGHDALAAVLKYRPASESGWSEVPLRSLVNDAWEGAFTVQTVGGYLYTLEAWVDPYQSWARDLAKRLEAGQDLSIEILIGIEMIEAAQKRASGDDAKKLAAAATSLRQLREKDPARAVDESNRAELRRLMHHHADRSRATTFDRQLEVTVDRERARFSAWYEMFPRSCAPEPGRHGTFRDCIARLDYVAGMGFDVLYLPPIHPIGRTNRKGRNNDPNAGHGDLGSPWAIGAEEGGHKAIHPQLGTLEDFHELVAKAREKGLEIALDIAFQCTPDHPYVKEHKEWFRIRPDGSVQYAENPPKKYQDIYPLYFDNDHARELCEELTSVVEYWVEQGVHIFRVDNPHTKPFAFWEGLIRQVKEKCPEAIFLSEAFTRPKVMYRLAKLGFTQSYTYFAWRNTKWELTQYFTELTQTDVREFLHPNLWPNTPDILTEYLQFGGRPAFMARLVLAATLGASYGIYGPAFEQCEHRPLRQGSEEYLNSEKYEIRQRDIDRPDSLKNLIARVNWIRNGNPALQADRNLRFHPVENEQLIAYSKATDDGANLILTVVNLDPYHVQSGWVTLPLDEFQLDPHQPYQVHDLINDARYLWQGPRNYVELNPAACPAHVFRVRRKVRSERDFDYYL